VILRILAILLSAIPLAAQTAPLDDLFRIRDSTTSRISSANLKGNNSDWVIVAPGETKTLARISGAGVVRRFYMAPLAGDRMRYRKSVLRMYWDGAKSPCVEVPLGDFFGSGLGTLRYFHSAVVDVNPGFQGWDFDGMVSYFPMPFEKGALITLENDGNVAGFHLWYHIDVEDFSGGTLPAGSGRFHAQWRREPRTAVHEGNPKNTTVGNAAVENATGEENFLVLDAEGHGNYVGLFLTVDNLAGGWYGEGDDMIFVDGAAWPPTYAGTGHEEIFNSGCCPDVEFWGAYTGFYVIENRDARWGGKNQMYRFYVNDPVRFRKSIRVTVEHGHANNFENDYTSTAFWYQHDPHKQFPSLPAAAQRLPVWPPGVQEAMEKELELQQRLSKEKIKISEADQKQWDALTRDRNQAFRALRYPEYLRAVAAMEAVIKRYLRPK
jgi:hypothetical protein